MVLNRSFLLCVGWCMVVFVWLISLWPLALPPLNVNHGDKWGHLLTYFVLSYWFLHLVSKKGRVVCGFILMGAMIEVLQGLTGYRYSEWADMLANCLGVLLAYGLFVLCQIKLKLLLNK